MLFTEVLFHIIISVDLENEPKCKKYQHYKGTTKLRSQQYMRYITLFVHFIYHVMTVNSNEHLAIHSNSKQ